MNSNTAVVLIVFLCLGGCLAESINQYVKADMAKHGFYICANDGKGNWCKDELVEEITCGN